MNRRQELALEQQKIANEDSLIENMNRDKNQQYVPKLNTREVQDLNQLGH